jgi:hypothetical protein
MRRLTTCWAVVLLLGLVGSVAFPLPLKPLLIENRTPAGDHLIPGQAIGGDYFDYLNVSKPSGERRYAFSRSGYWRSVSGQDEYRLVIEYRESEDVMFLNGLDEIDDYFRVRREQHELTLGLETGDGSRGKHAFVTIDNRIGGGAGLKTRLINRDVSLGVEVKPSTAGWEHRVGAASGTIPLSYYSFKTSAGLSTGRLDIDTGLSRLFPVRKEEPFHTSIEGYLIEADLGYGWGKTSRFTARGQYTDASAEFLYDGSSYGYVTGFRVLTYDVEQAWSLAPHHRVSVGVTGLSTRLGDRSYFDIWPFTYWDAFMNYRTRPDHLAADLHMPYVGYRCDLGYDRGALRTRNRLDLTYYHLLVDSNIAYKERYFVLWPVLMAYKPTHVEVDGVPDGLVRLRLGSSLKYGRLSANVTLSQLVPIRFGHLQASGGGGGGGGIGEDRHGGFYASLSVAYGG